MAISAVPGRRQVLVAWRHGGVATSAHRDQLTRRLRALYRPVFGESLTVTVRSVDAAGTTVGLVEETPGRAGIEDVVVWGDPVGAAGPATPEEIATALADEHLRRDLLGSFVIVGIGPDRVTLHSGADLVHTLMQCSGPDGEVWSTHGLAAVLASGRRPRVVAERIPEFVAHDFVFGDDHLLDGVTVLSEASTVTLSATGGVTGSWWAESERLRSIDGDLEQLEAALRAVLGRLVVGTELSLGLTAGRDSTLLAGTLAGIDRPISAFTMGGLRTPDGAGAAAVAGRLGWVHHFALPSVSGGPSLERLLIRTRLSEGMDTAWNFYGPDLSWPAELPPTRIAGVGGEMGRAFYWERLDESLRADPARAMAEWIAPSLGADGAAALRSRCEGFAARLYDDGWRGTGIFDGWHARGRVRRWVGSTPPPPGTRIWTVYPSAPVAGVLLGLPAVDRAAARSFDEAGRRAGDLRSVASAAVASLPGPPRWRTTSWGQRVDRRLRGDAGSDWVARCAGELGAGLPKAAEIMGAEWWRESLAEVRRRRRSPHQLWNLLAVEALWHVCDDVAREQ